MAGLQPFNYGNAIAQAEMIKSSQEARNPNSLNNLYKQAQLNALNNPAKTGNKGTYNPRDYTAESWAKFDKTDDPSVLKRYSRFKIGEVGGVRGLIDSLGEVPFQPQGTLSDEVDANRQLAGGTEQGKLDAKIGSQPVIDQQEITQAKNLKNVDLDLNPQIASATTTATEKAKSEAARTTPSAIAAAETRSSDIAGVIDTIDTMLSLRDDSKPYLSYAYGRENKYVGDGLKPQEWIDAEAQRDRIVSSLQLENVQKLKGTGPITENEQKILAKAASVLSNPLISVKLASREMRRVKAMFSQWRADAKKSTQINNNPVANKPITEMSDDELQAIIDGG